MMRNEFEDQCQKVSKTERIATDFEFENIHMVYCYHPSIQSKEDIALLFSRFGYAAIEDMLPRAKQLADLETKLRYAQQEIDSILSDMRDLGSHK